MADKQVSSTEVLNCGIARIEVTEVNTSVRVSRTVERIRGEQNGRTAASKQRSESPETGTKIKSSLLATWNNLKHGWTVQTDTTFKPGKPIWLLGRKYPLEKIEGDNFFSVLLDSKSSPMYREFHLDFTSRPWLTYRKDFPPIPHTTLTSDVGWGCMLRSGQMMLAEALMRHHLTRDWRWQLSPATNGDKHRRIIRLFGDQDDKEHPFSLHQLALLGVDYGKAIGDWFGPASTAAVLRDAVDCAIPTCPLVKDLRVYVSTDGTVYKQDVLDVCMEPMSNVGVEDSGISSLPASVNTSATVTSLNQQSPAATNGKNCESYSNSCGSHGNDALGVTGNNASSGYETVSDGNRNEEGNSRSNKDNCSGYAGNYPSSSHSSNTGITGSSATDNASNMDNGGSLSSIPPYLRSHSDDGAGVKGDRWHSLVLLIPVRLGGEELNAVYVDCLRQMLAHPLCLGIIGGKPKHALYFVGWQEDKLIYLDPHCCQPTVNMDDPDFPEHTYHCLAPRKTSFTKMDPTCTIGFYCRQRQDFEDLANHMTKMASPRSQNDSIYTMFVFVDGRCRDDRIGLVDDFDMESVSLPPHLLQQQRNHSHDNVAASGRRPSRGNAINRHSQKRNSTTDDFVFL